MAVSHNMAKLVGIRQVHEINESTRQLMKERAKCLKEMSRKN